METKETLVGDEASISFPNSITRAERIIAVCAIIQSRNHLLLDKMRKISDRKGQLTIIWDERPTVSEMNTVAYAWGILNESQIEHYLFSTDNLICHG